VGGGGAGRALKQPAAAANAGRGGGGGGGGGGPRCLRPGRRGDRAWGRAGGAARRAP